MMMIVMLKELDEQSEQSSTSAFHLLQSFLALLRLLLLLSALVESLSMSMFQGLLGARIVYTLRILPKNKLWGFLPLQTKFIV